MAPPACSSSKAAWAASTYENKTDPLHKESRLSVGRRLVATAITSCERAADLLVTGGCYADPQWSA